MNVLTLTFDYLLHSCWIKAMSSLKRCLTDTKHFNSSICFKRFKSSGHKQTWADMLSCNAMQIWVPSVYSSAGQTKGIFKCKLHLFLIVIILIHQFSIHFFAGRCQEISELWHSQRFDRRVALPEQCICTRRVHQHLCRRQRDRISIQGCG